MRWGSHLQGLPAKAKTLPSAFFTTKWPARPNQRVDRLWSLLYLAGRRPCVAPPRLVSPRLWIQLPPTDPHFTFFPWKKNTTVWRLSASPSHMLATQCDSSAMMSLESNIVSVMSFGERLKSRFENPKSFAKSEREAPSRSLPSPPSATCWNCPPGILSRQGNSQNKRPFLPFLFGCLQAGCHSYSLVHGF